MPAEFSDFKGQPVIVLKRTNEDKFAFSFGLSKAKLILDNLEAIQQFVIDTEAKKQQ